MPKQMFYNISKEKQEHIIDVAKKLFTTKPYDQISVSLIMREAGITRGSFYHYFNGLDDVFNLLFDQLKASRYQYAKTLLLESNHDFFLFMERLFEYDYDLYMKQHTYSLFKNYINFVVNQKKKSLKQEIIIPLLTQVSDGESIKDIFAFDHQKFEFDEMLEIIEVIMVLTVDLFVTSDQLGYTKEETLKKYHRRLEMIKYGIINMKKGD